MLAANNSTMWQFFSRVAVISTAVSCTAADHAAQ